MESDERMCRICHDSFGSLFSPCRCNGSTKYCHRQCLEKWRSLNRRISSITKLYFCELCKYRYRLSYEYPTLLDYVCDRYTLPEKILYTVSIMSTLFSLASKTSDIHRDKLKRNESKLESCQRRKFAGKWTLVLLKLWKFMACCWADKLKLMMISCMIIVVVGNCFLFRIWRMENRREIVLAYDAVLDNLINLNDLE